MLTSHQSTMTASQLHARCVELGRLATGHQLADHHLLDILDLGIDRTDLADHLAEYIDHGVDATIEVGDDDWEGAFVDSISAQ